MSTPPNFCNMASYVALLLLYGIAWSIHLNGNLGFVGFVQTQQKANCLAAFGFLNIISIDVITNTAVYFFLMHMLLIHVRSLHRVVHESCLAYLVSNNFCICVDNSFFTSFSFDSSDMIYKKDIGAVSFLSSPTDNRNACIFVSFYQYY